jgi:protein-disulfide isomerase
MTVKLELPIGPEDHILGGPNAVVTLVEYGDFECHYCARMYPIVKEIASRFHDSLRLVFRHAPQTRIHPNAELAAEATEAAGAQGKFWELHDRLFERPAPLTLERFLDDAKALGLDVERFETAIVEHQFRDVVTRIERTGAHTVRSTPTFFLDGERFEDELDAATLSAAIEAVRARATRS